MINSQNFCQQIDKSEWFLCSNSYLDSNFGNYICMLKENYNVTKSETFCLLEQDQNRQSNRSTHNIMILLSHDNWYLWLYVSYTKYNNYYETKLEFLILYKCLTFWIQAYESRNKITRIRLSNYIITN